MPLLKFGEVKYLLPEAAFECETTKTAYGLPVQRSGALMLGVISYVYLANVHRISYTESRRTALWKR